MKFIIQVGYHNDLVSHVSLTKSQAHEFIGEPWQWTSSLPLDQLSFG